MRLLVYVNAVGDISPVAGLGHFHCRVGVEKCEREGGIKISLLLPFFFRFLLCGFGGGGGGGKGGAVISIHYIEGTRFHAVKF